MAQRHIQHTLVVGTTEAQDFQLKADGANLVGTGLTLAAVVKDRSGTVVTPTGTFAWLTQASGTVRFLPAATDLPISGSPYTVRWSITDSGSKVAYVPNGDSGDVWTVVAV